MSYVKSGERKTDENGEKKKDKNLKTRNQGRE